MLFCEKIEYLSTAKQDLEEIFDFIAKDSVEAAYHILEEFNNSISKLKENPLLGNVPKNEKFERLGYRLLDIKNYFVFYVYRSQKIEIRRIIHGWNTKIEIKDFGKPIQHAEMMEYLKKFINDRKS